MPRDFFRIPRIFEAQLNEAFDELEGQIGTPAAEDVTFTPAGDIAATDVQAALEELDSEKVDTAGAEAAAGAYIDGLSGTHDATTALLGNNTFGAVNPAQASGGEITAGTETALRSYSPADILSFITTHAPGDAATSPFSNATGSQSGADSGKSWKLTGNVTDVPITDGWIAKYVNTSGTDKTITPASGTVIMTEDGTTPASVTLGNNKSCVAQGDGTNLIVDGDVT